MALGRTVEELQNSMSSEEFSEWIAFYSLEPFGYRADFHGFAMLACQKANMNRKSDTDPYKIEEFMPKESPDTEVQTSAQMLQMASMLTIALGGKVGE